jgi:hypothetical protein
MVQSRLQNGRGTPTVFRGSKYDDDIRSAGFLYIRLMLDIFRYMEQVA